MLSIEVKAQGLVYTPFIPQQSSSASSGSLYGGSGTSRPRSGYYRPRSETQSFRTTAYFVDFNGDYHKAPIRVEYTVYSNGACSCCVTEKWQSNGVSGQWCSLGKPADVQSCQPITANGITAELEQSFMYKAQVGIYWYYFDL